MELLARETLAEGSVDMISKIFDQNLEFVSLEHRLFSLDRPGSYVQYNDPSCPDAQVNFCARHEERGMVPRGLPRHLERRAPVFCARSSGRVLRGWP